MKKILGITLAILLFAVSAFGADVGRIEIVSVVSSSTAVSASATYTTNEINLDKKANAGIFAVYYTISGSGTAKIDYQASFDNKNWITPTTGNSIGSSLTAGSDILSFSPVPCAYMRFLVTETGGVSAIAVTRFYVFVQ